MSMDVSSFRNVKSSMVSPLNHEKTNAVRFNFDASNSGSNDENKNEHDAPIDNFGNEH